MAITGPRLQMPPAISQIAQIGEDQRALSLNPEWASFCHSLQQTAFALSRSGPTASRPTSTMDGRWIGMPYFDTSLGAFGQEIFLASVNPDVWVDGTGAAV